MTEGGRHDPYAVIRARFEALQLPVWRCNAAGLVLEEPVQQGLTGLWLRAGALTPLIGRAVAGWSGQLHPDLTEVDEAAWLIAVPEVRRRRLNGYYVALALGEQALRSRLFVESCRVAQLDQPAARRCLRQIATFDETGAARLLTTVRWMIDDQRLAGEQDETISGFTDQLTNAYETIDLLYALGHSMNEPNDPAQFVEHALPRIHESMAFSWIAAIFADDPDRVPAVHGQIFQTGHPTMDPAALRAACRRLVEERNWPFERIITSDVEYVEPDGGPQVVIQPILLGSRPAGWLLAGEKGGLDPQVSSYDTQLMEGAAGYFAPFLENASLYAAQRRMFLGTLEALTAAIDAKDPYTCGHSERVAHLAAELAGRVGMDREAVERVRIAGLVHDVGKIGVSEAVLTKSGRLTPEEFDAIKKHPEIGHRILRDIPMLRDVLPGVLHHHERWDGNGYPHRIGGEQIPLIARLIGIADSFDAMSSTRSYRRAMDRSAVLEEIRKCAGTQFDPELVEPFLSVDLSTYDEMVNRSAEAAVLTVEPPEDGEARVAA